MKRRRGKTVGFFASSRCLLFINILRGKTSVDRLRARPKNALDGGESASVSTFARRARRAFLDVGVETPPTYFTRVRRACKRRPRQTGAVFERRAVRAVILQTTGRIGSQTGKSGNSKVSEGARRKQNAPRSSARRGGAVGETSGTIDVSDGRANVRGQSNARTSEDGGRRSAVPIKRPLRVRFLDGVGAKSRVGCGAFRKRGGCVRRNRVPFRRTRALSRRVLVLFRRFRVL